MIENGKVNRLTDIMEGKAKSIFANANEVVEFIRKDFSMRSFDRELKRVIKERALLMDITEDALIKRLKVELSGQNVYNWLNDRTVAGRNSVIKIAFVLKMDAKEAQDFLMRGCWHDAFYMRDYKDIIYIFYLDKKLGYKLGYKNAKAMIDKYAYLDKQNPDLEKQSVGQKKGMSGRRITEQLSSQYEEVVSTEEKLDIFLKNNEAYFGSFRRKAYEKFLKMYNLLKGKDDVDAFAEDIITDAEICQRILVNIPSIKGANVVTNEILKKIAENTIQQSGLSEIINKKNIKKTGRIPQVSRKILILIWVVIYGSSPHFEDYSEIQDVFEECIAILNFDLLEECGMPVLDFRNPFDWLIFNAMYYCHFAGENEDADMEERVRLIMDELFKNGTAEEDMALGEDDD